MGNESVNPKVLVVEDNHLSRKVINRYIRDLGYDVIEAESGLTAMAIAGTGQPDIILLDLGIPDIDGFEVLRRIKTDNKLKQIPVLVITGRQDNEAIIRCMNLKADDYIIKPIDPVTLGTRIKSLIKAKNKKPVHESHFLVSLARTGAGTQFIMAALLISILPTLVVAYFLLAPTLNFELSTAATRISLSMTLLLVAAGYILLSKYPISIMRLRNYLSLLAKGDFSQEIHLNKDEDDFKAISNYISSIVKQTQGRIQTIEAQTKSLIEIESRKVMIESLGAACHHIGQPATVNITKYESEAYLPDASNEKPRADERILKIQE
jgi:CheY-like chemotaxis protein